MEYAQKQMQKIVYYVKNDNWYLQNIGCMIFYLYKQVKRLTKKQINVYKV